MKKNSFWRFIISLNIVEIIFFILSGIFTILTRHFSFSFRSIDSINTLTGTYYYHIGHELMIANLFFIVLSIIGIFFSFKKIKVGKVFLILSSLFFILNRLPDFFASMHFIYWVILIIIIYIILGNKNERNE